MTAQLDMLGEPPPVPKLRAPFPYFGGKSRAAPLIWQALGDVKNYVEPFAGSAATLLARPHAPRTETINDADGFISNFWRAVRCDPEAVAKWADYPVIEADLEARHAWLLVRSSRLRWSLEDPEFFDAKIAGWWVWGACAWIGSGWCSGDGPHVFDGAHIRDRREDPNAASKGINRQMPHLSAGRGINRQLPHLSAGQGINRKMPHVGDAGRGAFILEWMEELSARLRNVRVACGGWERVLSPSVTTRHGLTGIFLDPPYSEGKMDYAAGGVGTSVSADVAAWAIEHGDNPLNRIVLCGYEGEHDMPDNWRVVEWKASGGYGSQANGQARANSRRERLWLSPACLPVVGERPVREAVAS